MNGDQSFSNQNDLSRDEHQLSGKLSSLNQVLGGLKELLQKRDGEAQSFQEEYHREKTGIKETVTSLQASLDEVILNSKDYQSRIVELESKESSIDEEQLKEQLGRLELRVEQNGLSLEETKSNFLSSLEKFQVEYREWSSQWADERSKLVRDSGQLYERLDMLFKSLENLKASLGEIHKTDEEQWQQLREEVAQNAESLKGDLEERFQKIEGQQDLKRNEISELKELQLKFAESEDSKQAQLEQKFQSIEGRIDNQIENITDELGSFNLKFEQSQQKGESLERKLENFDQEIQALKESVHEDRVSDKCNFEDLKNEVAQIQKETELFKGMHDQLLEQQDQVKSNFSSNIEGIEASIESNRTLSENLNQTFESFQNDVASKTEKIDSSIESLNEHAKGIEDKRIEDIEQFRKQQREFETVKNDLSTKENELKDSKHEIRLLNNRLNEWQQSQKRERMLSYVSMAAVFVLSISISSTFINQEVSHEVPYALSSQSVESSAAEMKTPVIEEEEIAQEETSQEVVSEIPEVEEQVATADVVDETPVPQIKPAFSKVQSEMEVQKPEVVDVKVLEYVVQKDDSLWVIAKKHYGKGYLSKKIMNDNKLKSSSIKPGDVLRIFL